MSKKTLTLVGIVAIVAAGYYMYRQTKKDKVFANMSGFDVAGAKMK